MHWRDRINPCEHAWYWRLISWVETGCECCAATRMLIVAFPTGVLFGLALGGASFSSHLGAILFFFGWLLLAPVFLQVARVLWGGPDGMVRHDE